MDKNQSGYWVINIKEKDYECQISIENKALIDEYKEDSGLLVKHLRAHINEAMGDLCFGKNLQSLINKIDLENCQVKMRLLQKI